LAISRDAEKAGARSSRPTKTGRPTRAEAQSKQEALLDTAAELFLSLGYDGTTMEQIAATVGMTKRTIYARHHDKAALFRATVQRTIERLTASQAETLQSLEGMGLRSALTGIARMRLQQVTSTAGRQLQQIISAEARRFPEIFAAATEQITNPVVKALAGLLASDAAVKVASPELAAAMFLSMVAGAPSRVIAAGGDVEAPTFEERIEVGVEIFLNGITSGTCWSGSGRTQGIELDQDCAESSKPV
jgi:AcrR family transcriptional regulator